MQELLPLLSRCAGPATKLVRPHVPSPNSTGLLFQLARGFAVPSTPQAALASTSGSGLAAESTAGIATTAAEGDAAALAEASTSASADVQGPGWIYRIPKQREPKKPGWNIFSWFKQRTGPNGERLGMSTFERWYWGIGLTGLGLWLYSRTMKSSKKDEDINQEAEAKAKQEALERQRAAAIRGLLGGKSFLEEDAFEGLTPKEIQDYAKQQGLNISSDDPYEGMSPEEIDEYVRKHGITE